LVSIADCYLFIYLFIIIITYKLTRTQLSLSHIVLDAVDNPHG